MPDPKRLSIIVPYRDREEQLQAFLGHMLTYFARDKADRFTPYRITVVEQHDERLFNRGKLCNVGFDLTRDSADYFCFHDVDYLPLWADYSYPDAPMRIIWYGADIVPYDEGDSVEIKHDYNRYFGGVVLFNRSDFLAVNGFSNQYEGWGFEDMDLRLRCGEAGLEIKYRDGTFQPLHHRNAGLDRSMRYTDVALANKERLEKRADKTVFADVMKTDGVAQLDYNVVSREHPLKSQGKPVTHVEQVKVSFP
jgi:hypothetical protein